MIDVETDTLGQNHREAFRAHGGRLDPGRQSADTGCLLGRTQIGLDQGVKASRGDLDGRAGSGGDDLLFPGVDDADALVVRRPQDHAVGQGEEPVAVRQISGFGARRQFDEGIEIGLRFDLYLVQVLLGFGLLGFQISMGLATHRLRGGIGSLQRLAYLLHLLPDFIKERSAVFAVLDKPQPLGQHAGDGHEFPVGFRLAGVVEARPFGLTVAIAVSISFANHHIPTNIRSPNRNPARTIQTAHSVRSHDARSRRR